MVDEAVEINFDEKAAETDMAILFMIDDEEVWVPKSVINYYGEQEGIAEIKSWWAEREGLC